MPKTYVVIYSVGPGWLTGKPMAEQPLQEHWDYLQTLYNEGVLIEGGPYLDDSGGLLLIRAEDLDDAWDIVEHDPAVIDQIFVPEIHPWYQGDWANSGG
ncbi:MAG: YciI family protein [Anaerolineae bacterium]